MTYTRPMFERCLYFNVNALARSVNQIWEEAFSVYDLSPSHAYLLRLVLSTPGLTPGQISQELKLEKSTVSRFLKSLENKGMLIRKTGISDDARELGIFPTQRAKKMAADLEETGNRLYQKMLDQLGKTRLTSLVGELKNTERSIG